MKTKKPFKIKNATFIPNQLFDNRCLFLSSQQKIFLIYLYRRLWGYGETEIKLSYSVIFNDFPCIIKNKQKFSNMINDLAKKGLLNITRSHKKCNTYILNEENYKNLVYWSDRSKNKENTDIQNDIETEIQEKKITDTDLTDIDLNDNSLETLIKVYRYEYKKMFPKTKNIPVNELDFGFLLNEIKDIKNINYSTFIRCYFLKDFNDDKPKTDRLFIDGIQNYNKYKDIVNLTPIDDDSMLRVFKSVCDSVYYINGKTIEKCFDNNGLCRMYRDPSYYHIVLCSKTFTDKTFNTYTDKQKEIIEEIKKYPVIVDYVNNILKENSIFNKETETLINNTDYEKLKKENDEKIKIEREEKERIENKNNERLDREANEKMLDCF